MDNGAIRLNKYLAQCGVCSRRDADKLISTGKVLVNGSPAQLGQTVTEADVVQVGKKVMGSGFTPDEAAAGETVLKPQKKVVLACYKPVGVTCTERDAHAEKKITELIRYPVRVTYAGRLDKDSEGLILMTNDGELIDAMMRGANRHEKEYIVKVAREIRDDFAGRMSRGLYLKELKTQTRPCEVEQIGKYTFRIVLTQGLNRQIRRMCKELGYQVTHLKRVRVMNIELGDLKPGEYRELSAQERGELYRNAGVEPENEENNMAEEIEKQKNSTSAELDRIKYLVEKLNQASKAYYAEDREIMSNFEYDALYDELAALEAKTGIVLAGSPTVNVGYEAVDELPKERHESPMLSLSKTKDREELKSWLQGHQALLSWKLDGLTIVLTYRDGKLFKAVTRGNGEIGEVITGNARTFKNIPLQIAYQGELILRGEAVISYSDFERINQEIAEEADKYKNPRNLCSGSVRQLNNEITAKRNVQFFAFSLVQAEGVDFRNSRMRQFEFLKEQGFQVVEHYLVGPDTILDRIAYFEEKIKDYDIPSDGLVLLYEDIAYGHSLGRTAKFPRDSIAFKWADEIRETTLLEVEWSASRTGLINPVAIFEPVELEGTTVSRASVHNVSIVRGLKLGIGDRITVYKANMIIPQIAENLTQSDSLVIPAVCPVCGQPTRIQQMNDVQSLYCTNEQCAAKHIKAFTLFVSRDALNIDGLSEMTLEKFIDRGFIREFADLFHLDRYKEEITQMEGFGEKSYQNLIDSIETARNTTLPRLLYALGIAGIGAANAKLLCKHFDYDLEKIRNASVLELGEVEGIGEVLAGAITAYMQDEENRRKVNALLAEVNLEVPQVSAESQTLAGMSFVITGSLNHYENRDALKAVIEEKGGKVTGSVTGKTECLINNDVNSNSTKNKKAKELGVAILSEEEFIEKYLID